MSADFEKSKPRYSLRALLLLTAAIAVPFGLSIAWGANRGLPLCIVACFILYVITRWRPFAVAAAVYVAAIFCILFAGILDVARQGPYVTRFNERLQQMAIDAQLVGSSADRVEAVLGPATSISRGPTVTYIDTGLPTPDARYVTTYNFAPYPWFPGAKFQVHCEHGIVQSIELYDD